MAIEEKHNPMAKAVLQNKIFKQKSHGKNAKVYDRKKDKKMSLKEKIMARIEESKYSSWSEGQIEAEIQKLYRTINATGDEYLNMRLLLFNRNWNFVVKNMKQQRKQQYKEWLVNC
jgi:hypothetical protein